MNSGEANSGKANGGEANCGGGDSGRARGPGSLLLALVAVLVLMLALMLGACSSGEGDPVSPSDEEDAASAETRDQGPPRRPRAGQCYRLRYRDALAPTSQRRPVRCRTRHTSVTYRVGRLPLRDGRGGRLPVDSPIVGDRVAQRCTAGLAEHLGASPQQLRLSLASPVWFTPTLEESRQGARWFRCDVVVVNAPRSLWRLTAPLKGAYAGGAGPITERLAMCGTAAPDADAFRRVSCARPHRWRALRSVDLPDGPYPTLEQVEGLMGEACAEAAREATDDPLDVTWAQERPSRQRWRHGQRYGLCWAPVG